MKNLILSALIIFSFGCSVTPKVIHSDLMCPGIPKHGVVFTDEEKSSITGSVLDKFEKIVITYKQRIITQCEMIRSHNKIHSE